MTLSLLRTHFVCRHQVNQHCVQQLLRYGVALTNDGAHQVHHVHVHLLVVAVAGRNEVSDQTDKGSKVRGLQTGRSYSEERGGADEEVLVGGWLQLQAPCTGTHHTQGAVCSQLWARQQQITSLISPTIQCHSNSNLRRQPPHSVSINLSFTLLLVINNDYLYRYNLFWTFVNLDLLKSSHLGHTVVLQNIY